MREEFHKWCEQNDFDIGMYDRAPISVYNCRVTDKAWVVWQAAHQAGYDDGVDWANEEAYTKGYEQGRMLAKLRNSA